MAVNMAIFSMGPSIAGRLRGREESDRNRSEGKLQEGTGPFYKFMSSV